MRLKQELSNSTLFVFQQKIFNENLIKIIPLILDEKFEKRIFLYNNVEFLVQNCTKNFKISFRMKERLNIKGINQHRIVFMFSTLHNINWLSAELSGDKLS